MFLWRRIQECYSNYRIVPKLPEGFEDLRYEEFFAATARLIEIGDPVVPFLLKQQDYILKASDLDDRAPGWGSMRKSQLWLLFSSLNLNLCCRCWLPVRASA